MLSIILKLFVDKVGNYCYFNLMSSKIPWNCHHSFLVPVVPKVSQRLKIAASKSGVNITKNQSPTKEKKDKISKCQILAKFVFFKVEELTKFFLVISMEI